ncbi:uncharacterized protein KQ657_004010 [Scheffersomyces spartinae]|uniref:37S ribosomal protein S35, mitochondrial n=1 Tax=Scheffersomyces spartinae TaxID=45513 RepID=A0A9P7VBM3_9ASCO|nr:uncharacterized protein KQ657_004010 [Scheffersomyces spartinae]KAG7194902.1 hypothetical protein KQ657_004010 [Scheffersomyces spartinae]
MSLTQVRYRRMPALPLRYRPVVPESDKKDHSTVLQKQMKQWLGPRNIRGEYYRNKYYYPPREHRPNYVVPDGKSLVGIEEENGNEFRTSLSSRDQLQPFPQNPFCKTAYIVSHETKDAIYQEIEAKGTHVQETSVKYGLKINRVEAIAKLQAIEKSWAAEGKINSEISSFAKTMYEMFPLYNAAHQPENLTEIPIPSKTLQQRFISIAESEPFGPIEAAATFELEPASETLEKLAAIKKGKTASREVIIGQQNQGERTAFKFIKAKSGDVGFRYGASRRDRKKDRAVGFDKAGKMVYVQ